ncbi:hypothetical protein K4K51_008604 [Colletotrichum sp. SAR 10_75]|nr:hypothetical protein K4K51_008604 [Colletotrichum sp. SAR 10_75]
MHSHAPSAASQPCRLTLLDLPVSIIYLIVDELFKNDIYKYYGCTSEHSGYDIREEIFTGQDETYRAFDHWKDLSRMAASCKPFHQIITPVLYRLDVRFNYSSALLLSAKKGNLGGILKSIDLGHADLNMEDHTDFVEDEREPTLHPKLGEDLEWTPITKLECSLIRYMSMASSETTTKPPFPLEQTLFSSP